MTFVLFFPSDDNGGGGGGFTNCSLSFFLDSALFHSMDIDVKLSCIRQVISFTL
jgi:hypothetical protein